MSGWKVFTLPSLIQYPWKTIDSLITQGTALTTNKSKTTVDALADNTKIVYSVPEGEVSFEGRFRVDGSINDDNILEFYGMRGDDHYKFIGQLTITNGTQLYDTDHLFVDKIEWTDSPNKLWPSTVDTMSEANNSIATFAMNTHGYTSFLIICSTLASNRIYFEAARVA